MYRLSIIYIKHSGVLLFIISYVLPSLLVNGFHDLNRHSKKIKQKSNQTNKNAQPTCFSDAVVVYIT